MNTNQISRLLSLPLAWVEERTTHINNLYPELNDGLVLLNEFKSPFGVVMFRNTDNTPIDGNLIESILLSKSELEVGVSLDIDNNTICFRKNFLKKRVEKVPNFFEKHKVINTNALYKKSQDAAIGKDLQPFDVIIDSLESLVFQLHSIIRDLDGLHADEALDEICKIIYVKLYDEELTKIGEAYKFQRGRYSTIEECASVIRLLYKEANEYDKRVYSLRIPGYKRSRGVFDDPIVLSAEALAGIVELLENFSFTNSNIDLKGRIFQNLISPVLRGGLGQYFTPHEVVSFIVEVIRPQIEDLVIDPFAGSGHFLAESIHHILRQNTSINQKSFNEFLFNKLHGVEVSERMVRISMTDMRLHGDGHSNIRCVDSLLNFSNYQDLHKSSFDIVMTNPPFGSLVSSENTSRYTHFNLLRGRKNIPLELLGLERSIELLRDRGKIAIVLPDSVLVNKNLKFARKWILENISLKAIISLPVETFTPYGANIKTSILIGNKQSKPSRKNYPVFIAEVASIGYDASGRAAGKNELIDIAKEFKKFISDNNIQW